MSRPTVKQQLWRWLVLLGVLAWVGYQVHALIEAPGGTSFVSESGRYRFQNVPARSWLIPFGGMGYMRVTDRERPGEVWRTPLYSLQSLDMRDFENTAEVGIYWITFNKRDRRFEIAMPQWEPHWLNSFIANTDYDVSEDQARCRKPEHLVRYFWDLWLWLVWISDYPCTQTEYYFNPPPVYRP